MKRVRRQIRIEATPDEVWDVIGDLHTYGDFFVGATKWEPVGEVLGVPGDRWWLLLGIGSIETGGEIRITEVEPPRRIAWQSIRGTEHDAMFEVLPEGKGSVVTIEFAFRLLGPAAPIVEFSAGRMLTRKLVATLESLRHHIEFERR